MNPALSHGGHNADWRVDPNQVLASIGDVIDVEVRCAFSNCPMHGRVRTRRRNVARSDDVSTWRRFVWASGDYFVSGPRG